MPGLFLPPEGFLESSFSSNTHRFQVGWTSSRRRRSASSAASAACACQKATCCADGQPRLLQASRRARWAPISTPARIKNLALSQVGHRNSRLRAVRAIPGIRQQLHSGPGTPSSRSRLRDSVVLWTKQNSAPCRSRLLIESHWSKALDSELGGQKFY